LGAGRILHRIPVLASFPSAQDASGRSAAGDANTHEAPITSITHGCLAHTPVATHVPPPRLGVTRFYARHLSFEQHGNALGAGRILHRIPVLASFPSAQDASGRSAAGDANTHEALATSIPLGRFAHASVATHVPPPRPGVTRFYARDVSVGQ
jgi:hypothetical protein